MAGCDAPYWESATDRCSGSAGWVLGAGHSARVASQRRAARAARTPAYGDLPVDAVMESAFTGWDSMTLRRGWIARVSGVVPGRRYFLTPRYVLYVEADRTVGHLCVHADPQRFTWLDGLLAVVLAIDTNERSFLRRANVEPVLPARDVAQHINHEWQLERLLIQRSDDAIARAATDTRRLVPALERAYDVFVSSLTYDQEVIRVDQDPASRLAPARRRARARVAG